MASTDPAALNAEGLLLFKANRLREAAASFEQAIKLDESVASYHENLGMALADLGQIPYAMDSFRRALSLDPHRFMSLINMACLMQGQDKRSESEHYFERALTAKPKSYDARVRWANALLQFGDLAGAEKHARQAIVLGPNDFPAYEALGKVLSRLGNFDGAIENFRRAISIDPKGSPSSFQGIVSAKRIGPSDQPLVDQMLALLKLGVTRRSEIILHSSLGKAYDDIGDFGAAMTHYEEARECVTRFRGAQPLNRRSVTKAVEAAERLFTPEAFNRYKLGVETELPILIVGMPRSGTTLMEQIVSSHPEVGAAGELKFWTKSAIFQDPNCVFDTTISTELALEYRRLLRTIAPRRRRVTDKHPLNYAVLGPFHILFPNARIIHCRRHPVDTCLSILMNPDLLESPPDYLYDLNDLVFFYKQYQRIMKHWRTVLPAERFIEVDYEDMIANKEGLTRKVIEFCGLEWDECCLHHEKNERDIGTPSRWQARQPIYKTSLERWKNYEPWLGPLRELLPQ